MRERHLQYFETAARAGIEIRAVLDAVLGVDVGAGRDEDPCGLDIVLMSGDEQGRRACFVARIRLCAALYESADFGGIAQPGGREEFFIQHGGPRDPC